MRVMTTSTASFGVTRVTASGVEVFDDVVAIEEPLEMLIAWTGGDGPREATVSVTMRTPGDDFDLAAGFLITEAVIESARDIGDLRHWSSPNRVRVALKPDGKPDTSRLARNFHATASCGVCGKTSIDALMTAAKVLPSSKPLSRDVVECATRSLDEAQRSFRETGGVHGAAIVDSAGRLRSLREDIGRHNAVDKVIGSVLREGGSLRDSLLVVSSRAGFEIAQKAVVAGIPALISVGAASSSAIDLARRFNLTLIGFAREGRFNVYAGNVS